jgi:hypothetical protein
MLKGLAKKYLPLAGAALGNMVVPGLGGLAGSQLSSAAGRAFGLELEGLSPEDQEFEVNRRYVRTAEEAVKQAMNAPSTLPPQDIAKQALIKAAQIHAPGLMTGAQSGVQSGYSQAPRHYRSHSGRWIRRGRTIILLGV